MLVAISSAQAGFRNVNDVVIYDPSLVSLQGQLPVNSSYPVSVISPANMPVQTTAISFAIEATGVPAGMSAATAATYISVTPSTYAVTGPGQIRTVTITMALPADAVAGSYTFKIKAVGWPPGPDGAFYNDGTQIEATVTAAAIPFVPVSVAIGNPAGGSVVTTASVPVSVPFSFAASVLPDPQATAIDSVTCELDGDPTPVSVSFVGLSSLNVTGSGTLLVPTAGLHVIRVRAHNSAGTATAENAFTVQLANSPPTVKITSPLAGAVFTYDAAHPQPVIPFSFFATSAVSNITAYTATLNGSAITATVNGLDTTSLSGSATNLSAAGVGPNAITVSATNLAGPATKTAQFTVNPISVVINAPLSAAVMSLPAGATIGNVDFQFTAASLAGLPIDAASATLDGVSVPIAQQNLGGPAGTSKGTLADVAIGPHTLAVTGSSYNVPVTRPVAFRIKGTPLLNWATPAPITYGTPLSNVQLNATATIGGASVPGTFTYTPSAGSVLAVGSQPLNVTFVPTDTANYNGATGSVTLLVLPAPTPIYGTAIVRHAPDLNGNAGVDGSLQVLLGEDIKLNGNAWISEDLLVPGMPTIRINGHPTTSISVIEGAGSASLSSYTITLDGNPTLGRIVRQTDAVTIPDVALPPLPTGTRDVKLSKVGESAGDFATVRDLAANGNVGQVAVPPGTYRDLAATDDSGFTLGIAGSTQPAVYNLRNLKLSGKGELRIVGPVILNVANDVDFTGTTGNSGHPDWLTLNLYRGDLTLNGTTHLYATVLAPSGKVKLDGYATLCGGLKCDKLTINGHGLLDLSGNWPPSRSAP